MRKNLVLKNAKKHFLKIREDVGLARAMKFSGQTVNVQCSQKSR